MTASSVKLKLLSLHSLRATECEISSFLDINILLCKEGILCGRLEGRDTGTVLSMVKQSFVWPLESKLPHQSSARATYQLQIIWFLAFRIKLQLLTFHKGNTYEAWNAYGLYGLHENPAEQWTVWTPASLTHFQTPIYFENCYEEITLGFFWTKSTQVDIKVFLPNGK